MKLHFLSSSSEGARHALARLISRYGQTPLTAADAVVALGGDGFLLETLHATLGHPLPVYGMNRGSIGFMLNEFKEAHLPERVARAHAVTLHPLRMLTLSADGASASALAFNEVSLLRQTRQAAKLRIRIDGVVRIAELICDGALVSTAAGSTAYNLSAHGPIIPLGAPLLALTPISAFRPRRWRGALLPHRATVRFDVLEDNKRPVSATADFTEVRDVVSVEVLEDRSLHSTVLFDPEHALEERILKEQFQI